MNHVATKADVAAVRSADGMYSARTAARIARVPPQTFQAWIKANLVRPRKLGSGRRPENTYTYDDLLLIRLIVRLKEQGASVKSIRAALDTVEYMCDGNRAAWKQVEMSVSSDLVVVMIPGIPDWNPVAASRGPQKMAAVFFPELIAELRNELVPPDRFRHIDVDPEVLGGSPTVKGTRISTRAVMSAVESDIDPKEVYPALTDEQISEVKDYERSFLQVA